MKCRPARFGEASASPDAKSGGDVRDWLVRSVRVGHPCLLHAMWAVSSVSFLSRFDPAAGTEPYSVSRECYASLYVDFRLHA